MSAGIAYILTGFTLAQSIVLIIGLIVAQVPEGLQTTMSTMLTLTAKRMTQKNCLVRNLKALESLGSTSVICTEKTGTLTQNKMTVSHVWCNRILVDADTLKSASGTQVKYKSDPTWQALVRVACLCSKAEFHHDPKETCPLKW